MSKRTQNIILAFTLVIFILIPVVSIQAAEPTPPVTLKGAILGNLGIAGGVFGNPGEEPKSLPEIVAAIIKLVLSLLGTLFIILIMYGGFIYMTASGSPEQAKKGGGVIRDAVIGLVIVFVSYAITVTIFDILLRSTYKL